ncbi:MAG: hypothetical protein Q9172_002203 [Xanthocarpia lactea]
MAEQLRKFWSDVPDVHEEDIQDNTNTFEVGGDSVTAMHLVTAALESNTRLDVDVVFSYPKLMDMAAKCTTSQDAAPEVDAEDMLDPALLHHCAEECAVSVDMIDDIYPATQLQIRLLQMTKEPGVLVEFLVMEVQGTQHTSRIQAVFELMQDRNAILRTRFVEVPDQGSFQVVVVKPITWATGNDILAYIAKEKNRPFGFGKPLTNGLINQNNQIYIVWTAHHSVQDEWCRKLLLDDLETCITTADHPSISSTGLPLGHSQCINHRSCMRPLISGIATSMAWQSSAVCWLFHQVIPQRSFQ